MIEKSVDVYLLGSSLTGEARAHLLNSLAALFKKEVPVIERMLRKSHTLIKANVDLSLAEKYKQKIKMAGGRCELVAPGTLPGVELPIAQEKASFAMDVGDAQKNISVPTSSPKQPDVPSQNSSNQFAHFCNKCGVGLTPKQTRCHKCSAPVKRYTAKNKTLAGFLALLLGGLGVHRFYLGQWWGIFYLLFFFTLIPLVIAIVEAFVFWFSSDETWDGKYGNVEDQSMMILVVAIGGFIGFIMVTGILAAVAIPQYQIYVDKSKVFSSIAEVTSIEEKVEGFYFKTHEYPNDGILIGISEEINSTSIQSIEIQSGGAIVVTYKVSARLEDPTIIWRPSKMQGESKIRWSCEEGGLPNKYRPKECWSAEEPSGRGNTRSNSKDSLSTESSTKRTISTKMKSINSPKSSVSLSVPSDWSRNDKLNDTALLGVSSANEKYYAMVASDTKVDFDQSVNLQKYIGLLQKGLEGIGKNHEFNETQYSIKNGMPVAEFEMKASMEGVKLGYTFYVVETETHFYRVLAWTLQSTFEEDKHLLEKVTRGLELHEQ